MASDLIRVTYVKSAIGYTQRQKETVRSLGLRHLGDAVIHESSPAILGMVRSVAHLVAVEPMSEAEVVSGASGPGGSAQTKGRKSKRGKGAEA
jgi:large subunit ribosomal protein L30